MMKKTLLSIMTMAILASSTAAYSNAVTKDITVEATIPASFSMSDDAGKAIESAPLKMTPDADNKGSYIITKPVRFTGNGKGLTITMNKEFKLVESTGAIKEFTDIELKLDSQDLTLRNQVKLGQDKLGQSVNLVISGKEPDHAMEGETYSGTLQLKLEADA
ncbi:CS1 type fimbrial major subunit [Yersinia sp. Marseille-Q3913]|uniref:CS1 type fimbrial major subunit n=1 Tax=Yersinia sp. Marseille-Q3913 TaxID=2830769 RepID=UPI001BAEFDA0|nr:CS1 type fimbrial major subunit [Yersinia sp. Marseille-Q3913]MBS0056188.1 hypothetical protein [Yersinia sp. Marseille-Q3913]